MFSLQEVIDSLKDVGRTDFVVDEGLRLRANEHAFVQTKQTLLDEYNCHWIVGLASGVFTTAEPGVKGNALFFSRGEPAKSIWY